MSRTANSKAPRGMPFIFLKSKESENSEPRKILIPTTLNELKQKAKKVLKLQNQIVEMCLENGSVLKNINMISPGDLIIVSDQTKKGRVQKKSIAKTKKVDKKPPINQNKIEVKQQNQFDFSDSLSYDDEEYEKLQIQREKEKEKQNRKSNLPIYQAKKIIKHDYSDNYNYSDEDDEYETETEIDDTNGKYYFTPKIEIDKHESVHTSDNEEEEEVDKKFEKQKEETETDEEIDDTELLIKLFNTALPENGFDDDIRNIITFLPPKYVEFLKVALDIEDQHRDRWTKALFQIAKNAGFEFKSEKIHIYEDIENKANDMIKNHFFASPFGPSTVNKTVIDGPRKSGKTTFLSLIIHQYILTMASHNMWKKSFLLIMNCEDFSFYASDLKLLYLHFVALSIDHLTAQVPDAIPYSEILKKYFTSIVESKHFPSLSKKFCDDPRTSKIAAACKLAASMLAHYWNSPNGRDEFCYTTFMLPVLLAKNLDFTDITFLVDNFDLLNVIIDEVPQFPSSRDELIVIEQFKRVLYQSNFVITCKDSDEMFFSLNPLEANGIDLTSIATFESTMDVSSVPQYEGYEFSFRIDEVTYKITAHHFGGIPAYISKWIELNEYMDEVVNSDKDDPEYEDKYAEVVNELQSIIPLIFVGGKDYNNIYDVHRKTANVKY